jgi:Na+(H+)/acetate symporter ActP
VTLLFVFASPAGSSANLIASEIFPTASRTIVLFVMFMVSMLGGMCGVWFDNYLAASILMVVAGVAAFIFCPNSENKSL